jgi:site-specific recombinase XerC
MRRVRVVGKGNKERSVPVDRVFFTELGNYVSLSWPTRSFPSLAAR